MVKVEVIVPTELSDEQRAAVESLAEVTEAAPGIAVDVEGDEADVAERRTPTRRCT